MDNNLVKFDELVSDLTAFVAPVKAMAVTDKGSCDKATLTLKELKFWEKKIEEKRKELVGPLNDQVKRINDYVKTILAPLSDPERHLKSQLMDYERVLEKEREEQRRLEREAQAKREAEARAAIAKQEEEARALLAKQKAEADAALKQAQEDAEALAMFAHDDDQEKIRAEAAAIAAEIEAKAEKEAEQIKAKAHMEMQKTAFDTKQAHWDASKEIKANKVTGATKRWVHEVEDESLVPRQFLMVDEKKAREYYMGKVKDGSVPTIPGFRIYQETSISVR